MERGVEVVALQELPRTLEQVYLAAMAQVTYMLKNLKDELGMAWLVAWRELRDQLRDWRMIFPMIALTLLLPFLADLGALAAINFTTQYGTPLIAERLVPFLLMVVGYFPITISLVIALESFVGEKERGTIEPLLSSPLKDWQLFMGKLLSGTIAPLFTCLPGHHGLHDRPVFPTYSFPGCQPDGANANSDRSPGFPDGHRSNPHFNPGYFGTRLQPDGLLYRHTDGVAHPRRKRHVVLGQ